MTTDTLPTACAWHFGMTPPQLMPLNGTTIDQALLALEDGTLSHGICEDCEATVYATHGLVRRTR